jgi:uncharacterized protein (DUF1697 family)
MAALVVFLRGINVGGHKRFRPSVLAEQLKRWDVVNIGAAGTFVLRDPPSRTELRGAIRRRLPFEAEIVICAGREVSRMVAKDPFGDAPIPADVVRFVSVLAKKPRKPPSLPIALPDPGKWLVRILASENRFVFGVYRRHMRTISCLGSIDDLFGSRATTRSWSTLTAIDDVVRAP